MFKRKEKKVEDAVKSEDKVPMFQKITYSMGVVSDHYANVCLVWIFITPFFVDFLGLNAAIIGVALFSARIWDAFTDPLVGKISDGTKSRFGRRKPFVFVGAILTGLMFPVVWMVPEGWSSTYITVWLFVALMVFYSVYSIFSVPYEALGAELTPDYSERNWIFIVRKYIQEFFNLGIVWIFPMATYLAQKYYNGSDVQGIRAVSWVVAGVIIIAGILPAIFNKERYKDIAEKEGSVKFSEAFGAVKANKPLLKVIGVIATYLFAITATANLTYFVNAYYIFEGHVHKGATLGGIDGTLRLGFAWAAAFVIGLIGNKVDKHKIMIASCATLLVAFVGLYFTTVTGNWKLALAMKPLVAIGECGFWVLILSMRADVCDWDEYTTGKRNEGMIAAITNWVNKSAMAFAVLLAGLNLQYVVGFDKDYASPNKEQKAAIVAEAEVIFASMPEDREARKERFVYDRGGEELVFEASKKPVTEKAVVKRLKADFSEKVKAKLNARAEAQYSTLSEEQKLVLAAEEFAPLMELQWKKNLSAWWSDIRGKEKELGLNEQPITLEAYTKTLERVEVMKKLDKGTLERLRIFYSLPQAGALLLCLYMLAKYPLTKKKMEEIRAELESRRGETSS